MKKLLSIVVLLATFCVVNAQQQPENCPFGGRENCTGYCGLFNDNNNDGFCDYSILTSEKKESTPATQKQETTSTEKKDTTSVPEKKTTEAKSTQTKEETTLTTPTETTIVEEFVTESLTTTETNIVTKPKKVLTGYQSHFMTICLCTILLYCITALLVKSKKMKKVNHRKIWNFLLLVTFLVSCLLGLYIAIARIYDLPMNYKNLILLHVDFGVSMTIISIFHIVWHIKYFKNMFSNAK